MIAFSRKRDVDFDLPEKIKRIFRFLPKNKKNKDLEFPVTPRCTIERKNIDGTSFCRRYPLKDFSRTAISIFIIGRRAFNTRLALAGSLSVSHPHCPGAPPLESVSQNRFTSAWVTQAMLSEMDGVKV